MDDEVRQADEALRMSYRDIAHSVAWADLIAYLEQERDTSLSEAEDSVDIQKAYGLLQKAQAYKTIRSYLDRMTSVPTDY